MIDFNIINDLINGFIPDSLAWLGYTVAGFIYAFMIINLVVMTTALYIWFERRAMARFQSRLGPNRWGPFGLLQPIADVLKLLAKEDVIPAVADKKLFALAPIVLLFPALIVFSVIPLYEDSYLGRLNVGVLFVLGVTGVNTIAILMAGWSSRNKYALLGAMRGVAMLISYEVPMVITLLGTVLMAGSISLSGIVASQSIWFIITQPLGFLVFIIAASAEMSRAPFDMIESESELGAGYHTEYSGIKFGILQLAEFMAPIITAVLVTVLFLGGAKSHFGILGPFWFAIKTFAVIFVLLWVRVTLPRLRVDQIMAFAWKGLLPMAIINTLVIAVEVYLFNESSGTVPSIQTQNLLIMAVVNWIVAGLTVYLISRLMMKSDKRNTLVQEDESDNKMFINKGSTV
jgi:NADH-quinone oxidoreductase subunit H